MTTPKLTTYDIATRGEGGNIERTAEFGYTCGLFGCCKGPYFYAFTHLPTGLSVVSLNAQGIDHKPAALVLLQELGEQGLAHPAINDYERDRLSQPLPWGGR